MIEYFIPEPIIKLKMLKPKDQSGFIPLLITIVIVLAAIVWLGYKQVASVQK